LRNRVAPDGPGPDRGQDLAQAVLVDRRAAAQELDFPWRLDLAHVEPDVDGVDDAQVA
jgi:hypothetical protein